MPHSKLILPPDYRINNPNIINEVTKDLRDWHETKPAYFMMGRAGSGKTLLARAILESIRADLRAEYELSQALERKFDFTPEGHQSAVAHNTAIERNELRIKRELGSILFLTAREAYSYYLKNDFTIPEPTSIFCLDDIGAEVDTESSRKVISSMLMTLFENYESGYNKLIIVTTNLSGNQIKARYGVRETDRTCECYKVFKFEDYSFREEKLRTVQG